MSCNAAEHAVLWVEPCVSADPRSDRRQTLVEWLSSQRVELRPSGLLKWHVLMDRLMSCSKLFTAPNQLIEWNTSAVFWVEPVIKLLVETGLHKQCKGGTGPADWKLLSRLFHVDMKLPPIRRLAACWRLNHLWRHSRVYFLPILICGQLSFKVVLFIAQWKDILNSWVAAM